MKKKLLLILGLVVMVSVSLFVSCTDEDTDNPPTLTFTSPASSSSQVGKGEGVVFQFIAFANANSNSDLDKVTIVANYSVGGSTTVLDTNVPSAYSKQFGVTKTFVVPTTTPYGSVITVTVKVIDEAGQSAQSNFTLTVANLSDINEYLNVTIGAQGNLTLGSAFASDSGKVYFAADAKKWQTRIDLFYIFDGSQGNAHSICAPNDGVLAAVSPGLVSGWTSKNATKFKLTTMTTAEFDAITDSDQIKQKWTTASGSESSIAPTLDDGSKLQQSYVLFKTVKTKYGVIQITSITETTTQKESSMFIKVKVER
jgi:hypothetical protein